MATLQAAPTRHRHTEQFSRILPDQYLPGPCLKREGGMEKNQSTKWHAKQQGVATTLYEELQASNCVYKSRGAPARGIGPPLV